MQSIIAQGLGKRYKLGKRSKADSGLDRILNILEIFSGGHDRDRQNDLWALHDIDLSVEQGEVLGIIGPNGAGKTTLLKILAQVTAPTTGYAVVRGRVVSLLELGAGFQPDLTARENIYLNAAFYGIRRQEVDQYFDELIEFAELEKFSDSPVKHFSSGMYIRLAFSNAIHMRPDILLADEVLAVGDIAFQRKCMDRMQEISTQGITTLFVSHDMEAIRRLCSRCIYLSGGEIVDEGDPDLVTERYENVSLRAVSCLAGKEKALGGHSHVQSISGAIKSVKLLSARYEEVGALRVSEDHFLAMTFECGVAGAKAFGSFDVWADDTLVFRTFPQQVAVLDEAGIYQVRARVPGHLLAETDYSVNAGLRLILPEGEDDRLNSIKALSFRAYDPAREDFVSGMVSVRTVGVVNPRLAWEMEFMRGHHDAAL